MKDPKTPDNEEINNSSEDGSDEVVPAGMMRLMQAISEAAEELDEEEQAAAKELYGSEVFQDEGLTYAEDLAKYDQAAYTRNKQDYTAYRYNLNKSSSASNTYYEEGDLRLYGEDDLGGDLEAGSATEGRTTFGGAPAGYTHYSSTSKGTYSYSGGGSWATSTGGWQSSWYSGYKSADLAIKGVHDSVSSFVTAPGFGSLEIVPDLENVDAETYLDPAVDIFNRRNEEIPRDTDKTMVVRIDSTLYEKLGIAEAQQHYIVDAISQVFAIQTYPDPFLITLLQSGRHGTVIPNVTREIVTEMMRAKGLPILLDQMPGWLKRVTAFRSAMYIGEPPDASIPSAYLMYGVWERDSISTLEQEDAIKAIDEIEALLSRPAMYLGVIPRGTALSRNNRGDYAKAQEVTSNRESILADIDTILVRYITGHGSAGEVIRLLRLMSKSLHSKIAIIRAKSSPTDEDWLIDEELYRDSCEQLIPLVHDHNRTFCPDPSNKRTVRHMDFPECPNLELLNSTVRARVEFTRKCLFNLDRIPAEAIQPGSDGDKLETIRLADKRVRDMIEHMEKAMKILLEAAERASRHKSDGDESDSGNRSNRCTNHPELRMKNPIGGDTERNFNGEDPNFSRPVKVLDSTI
jgi:hypothetical protein